MSYSAMKCALLLIGIYLSGCASPYNWIEPKDLQAGRMGVVSSVSSQLAPYRLQPISFVKEIKTPITYPVEEEVFKAVENAASKREGMKVVFLRELSDELSEEDIFSANPYRHGALKDEMFDRFAKEAKSKSLDYIVYVEDIDTANQFSSGPTNQRPLVGLGVYSANGNSPHSYASLRVGIYRAKDNSLSYADDCFGYAPLAEEYGDFIDSETLPKEIVEEAKRHISFTVNRCVQSILEF